MDFVFEFDEAKSASNKDKHGIDFGDAQALWRDEELILFPAKPHAGEMRWGAIGVLNGKHWTAFFTLREQSIRLFSVRRSRKSEEFLYERSKSRQGL